MEQSRPSVLASKQFEEKVQAKIKDFSEILNYQTIACKVKTKESANESPLTTTKLSYENLKDKMEPVVTEQFELGYGE